MVLLVGGFMRVGWFESRILSAGYYVCSSCCARGRSVLQLEEDISQFLERRHGNDGVGNF